MPRSNPPSVPRQDFFELESLQARPPFRVFPPIVFFYLQENTTLRVVIMC